MERKLILLPLIIFLLTSCAQNGFQAPLASVENAPATTTYSPPKPIGKMIGTHQVVEGASQVSELKLNIDGAKATAALKGTVTVQPAGGSSISVPFDVSGTINSDEYTSFMKATNPSQMASMDLQVGAKLTCLYTDCTESFIDIYVNYKGVVYHHQVEAKGNDIPQVAEVTKETPTTESPSESKVKDKQPNTPEASKAQKPPLGEVKADEDDGSQYEHDIDEESEMGQYVGEPQKDLEVLFPDSTEKNDSPDASKIQDLKKDDANTIKNTDEATDFKTDRKQPNIAPVKSSGGSGLIKGILKGLGQAVTDLRRKSFTKGHLENPTDILAYEVKNTKAGFHIIYPKRQNYYGTNDMLSVLANMGRYSQQKMKGYVLSVGDVSAKNGGPLGRHSSHQMGLDADISYYFDSKEKKNGLKEAVASSKPVSSFMADEQWDMFKMLVSQGNVDRIFIHPVLKKELCGVASRKGDLKPSATDGAVFETLRVMRPEVHHDDHFHLRLKCSTAQPRCRQMAPPKNVTGC